MTVHLPDGIFRSHYKAAGGARGPAGKRLCAAGLLGGESRFPGFGQDGPEFVKEPGMCICVSEIPGAALSGVRFTLYFHFYFVFPTFQKAS